MAEFIHVIDDDEGVRLGLCALLESKGYNAVPHDSCENFLITFSADAALCIVADLRLPGMGGLDLQTQLVEREINLPFIVITGHGDVPSAVRALKSGATDFIEKPIEGRLFMAAIEKAVKTRLEALSSFTDRNSMKEKLSQLTPREHDVLKRLVDGNSNKIIAYELGISPRTVENHRARLMDKMEAESVAELVRMAVSCGIA